MNSGDVIRGILTILFALCGGLAWMAFLELGKAKKEYPDQKWKQVAIFCVFAFCVAALVWSFYAAVMYWNAIP